jgi:hypothetical protein
MHAGRDWLAYERIWPHAEIQHRNGRGDLTGTGGLLIEMTTEPWERLNGPRSVTGPRASKMVQAERDAQARGLGLFCVWKRGRGQPAEDTPVVFRAGVIFPVLARYFVLAEGEADWQGQLDLAEERGYRLGYKAAQGWQREGSF